MANTVFPTFQTSSISHQQAEAEHWNLPNTEIFQSNDVASASVKMRRFLISLFGLQCMHIPASQGSLFIVQGFYFSSFFFSSTSLQLLCHILKGAFLLGLR
jgi:hypothetical protein